MREYLPRFGVAPGEVPQSRLPDHHGDGAHSPVLGNAAHIVLRLGAGRAAPGEMAEVPGQPPLPEIAPGLIADLVDALLRDDLSAAEALVQQVQAGQTSLRPSHLGLLAPAVRQLGRMWEDDDLSFLGVTTASCQVAAIMRKLRHEQAARLRPNLPGRVALFAAVPGEDHTLGVTMAADLFREAGWQVDLRPGASYERLIAEAEAGKYPVIGLSAAHVWAIPSLTRTVEGLRAVAPRSRIVLAGNLLDLLPAIGTITGVDAASTDADKLLARCETFVAH